MKRTFGVAALLGLLTTGALATSAQAQCGTGPMIILNTASFAWETGTPVGFPYISTVGNNLYVVGLVQKFCYPFQDQDPSDPTLEFSVYYSGLVSNGTTLNTVGSTNIYTTTYSTGSFEIWRDSPRNAYYSAAAIPAPTDPTIPANYRDGTMILSGTLANFIVQVTKTGTNNPNGSHRADATFTGGSLYSRVQNAGTTLEQGNWCVFGCLPPSGGYSAQLDGKFDTPPTAAHNSTWGAIKLLYH